MINHPSVIEKAHAELDNVIGAEDNRLITVADKTNLPYINAIINVSNFIKLMLIKFRFPLDKGHPHTFFSIVNTT